MRFFDKKLQKKKILIFCSDKKLQKKKFRFSDKKLPKKSDFQASKTSMDTN